MNRRQRRAQGENLRRRLTGEDIRRAVECPDCLADLQPVQLASGRVVIEVRHDPCCPWLAQFERDGGRGVRFI